MGWLNASRVSHPGKAMRKNNLLVITVSLSLDDENNGATDYLVSIFLLR